MPEGKINKSANVFKCDPVSVVVLTSEASNKLFNVRAKTIGLRRKAPGNDSRHKLSFSFIESDLPKLIAALHKANEFLKQERTNSKVQKLSNY